MSKMSVSTAWDQTRDRIARDGSLHMMVAAAMLVLPLTVILTVSPAEAGEAADPSAGVILLNLLTALISQVGSLALMTMFLKSGTSVGEAIRHALRKIFPALGATLLWVLPLVLIGYLLFTNMVEIAPGVLDDGQITPDEFDQVEVNGGAILGGFVFTIFAIYISVRMMLVNAVAVAEGNHPVEILKRGWNLTKGNFWRLFGLLFLLVVTMLVVLLVAGLVFGMIAALISGDVAPLSLGALIVGLGTAVVQAGFAIVFAGIIARLYAQAASEPVASVPPTS